MNTFFQEQVHLANEIASDNHLAYEHFLVLTAPALTSFVYTRIHSPTVTRKLLMKAYLLLWQNRTGLKGNPVLIHTLTQTIAYHSTCFIGTQQATYLNISLHRYAQCFNYQQAILQAEKKETLSINPLITPIPGIGTFELDIYQFVSMGMKIARIAEVTGKTTHSILHALAQSVTAVYLTESLYLLTGHHPSAYR